MLLRLVALHVLLAVSRARVLAAGRKKACQNNESE